MSQHPHQMTQLTPELDRYAADHTSPEPPLLTALNRETHLRVLYPRMLSGAYQGRLLAMLSQLVRPRRVLEIGTYTGYSCLCMAEGLAPDGLIHTLELNEEREAQIFPYLEKAGIRDRVHVHFGNALEIIPTLDETWDLVFLDADKQHYVTYYEQVLPRLRPGGLLLADNVLWSGRIMEENPTDKELRGLQAFNDHVIQDSRVECVLLPVRDGIMMVRRK